MGVVAEIEIEDEEESVRLPDWVGQEVSEDRRYTNFNLTQHPFSKWE